MIMPFGMHSPDFNNGGERAQSMKDYESSMAFKHKVYKTTRLQLMGDPAGEDLACRQKGEFG